MVFDVASEAQWELVKGWNLPAVSKRDSQVVILVGNTNSKEKRVVSKDVAAAYAKEQDIKYFEVSTYSKNKNVSEAVKTLQEDTIQLLFKAYANVDNKVYNDGTATDETRKGIMAEEAINQGGGKGCCSIF